MPLRPTGGKRRPALRGLAHGRELGKPQMVHRCLSGGNDKDLLHRGRGGAGKKGRERETTGRWKSCLLPV